MKPYTPKANVLMLISLNQNLKNFKVNIINYKELTRKLARPLIINCIFNTHYFSFESSKSHFGWGDGKNVGSMFVSDDAFSHCS